MNPLQPAMAAQTLCSLALKLTSLVEKIQLILEPKSSI